MLILRHILRMALCCGVYFLGKAMVISQHRWAAIVTQRQVSSQRLSKFFLYSGRTFEVVGFVWGFLEVVAVVILTSGWVTEMLVGPLV